MLVGHFLFKRRKYKRVVITIDFFAIKMRALIATLKKHVRNFSHPGYRERSYLHPLVSIGPLLR